MPTGCRSCGRDSTDMKNALEIAKWLAVLLILLGPIALGILKLLALWKYLFS